MKSVLQTFSFVFFNSHLSHFFTPSPSHHHCLLLVLVFSSHSLVLLIIIAFLVLLLSLLDSIIPPQLVFRPFSTWAANSDWTLTLRVNEDPLVLAMGDRWTGMMMMILIIQRRKKRREEGRRREEHWTLTLPVNEDPRARNARQMDR